MKETGRLIPAEWEAHDATWIAWPHNPEDWPLKFEPVRWVYADIVKHLVSSERVEILCHDSDVQQEAESCLRSAHISLGNVRFHLVPNNRSWLRDSAPTAIREGGRVQWVRWHFNGWAKYSDYEFDREVPERIREISGLAMISAFSDTRGTPFVLEGGAIDTDGEGTLLVTEECLLSEIQARNAGMSREEYEQRFREYLGVSKTIWLKRGLEGDDTHGHIDDVARFVGPATVVLSFEEDRREAANYESSGENFEVLQTAADARGRRFKVIKLPLPAPVYFNGQRLPASYANFYIANGVVLVPTFNDPNDRIALQRFTDLFPDRRVIGIHSTDLVLGLGTLHCLTQQQPRSC